MPKIAQKSCFFWVEAEILSLCRSVVNIGHPKQSLAKSYESQEEFASMVSIDTVCNSYENAS